MRPTVSVYIPTFNRAYYLEQTVQSVLDQTFTDFEIIIIDYHSTDNTRKVVNDFDDSRIRYVLNQKNLGCVASNNRGLALSIGRYVCNLDSDDLLHPKNLEVKVKLLETDPRLGLVYSDAAVIDAEGKIIYASYWKKEGYFPVRGRLNSELVASCGLVIHQVTTLFRREVIDVVGYQNPHLVMCHDGEYWLRIAGEFEIDYIPEVLCSYRDHDDGRHLTELDETIYVERADIVRSITDRYPEIISHLGRRIFIANYLCQGGLLLGKKRDYVGARRLFRDALRECPYHLPAFLWFINTYVRYGKLSDFEILKKVLMKALRLMQ